MRLLLDENLDWRLQRDLPAHQVESVPPPEIRVCSRQLNPI
jgi:predicted nuclease of predicted toxin-antitoxin system